MARVVDVVDVVLCNTSLIIRVCTRADSSSSSAGLFQIPRGLRGAGGGPRGQSVDEPVSLEDEELVDGRPLTKFRV